MVDIQGSRIDGARRSFLRMLEGLIFSSEFILHARSGFCGHAKLSSTITERLHHVGSRIPPLAGNVCDLICVLIDSSKSQRARRLAESQGKQLRSSCILGRRYFSLQGEVRICLMGCCSPETKEMELGDLEPEQVAVILCHAMLCCRAMHA